MERKEIQIPKGCKNIEVDIERGIVLMHFESETNERLFDCEETGDTEERPGMGDFSIFWNRDNRSSAFCANYVGMVNGEYISSRGACYEEAIKFRNYEQYLKVRDIYEE